MSDAEDWIPPDDASETRVSALPGTFRQTDLGNAERLVARYRDRIRYCPQRRKWLLWDGTRWRWDETAAIERMAKRAVREILHEAADSAGELAKSLSDHAFRSEAAKRIRDMVSLAQSEDGMPVLLDQLDSDPWLLNAKNGTIELKTASLRDHSRSDLITRTTSVDYIFGARSALWDRVLSEACGGDPELAEYIQRAMGYSLLGLPLERAFFFLHGPPGTAKSTLIDAIHAAIGGYVEEADFDTWLQKPQLGGNRGDLVRLAGARLVTSREAKPGAKWDEALLKRVTGGDPLTVAAKYENEVTFRPSFALLFAANDAPGAREDDEGFWARMRRIPMAHVLPLEQQDRSLKMQLREAEHAQAILFWAVQGCTKYITDGLGSCKAVADSTAEYRSDLDHFAEFLSDCFIVDRNGCTSRLALRKKYEAWAEEVNRKSLLTAPQIASKLRLRDCGEKIIRGTRYWYGLRERELTDE
jgi:putative DNA primase/helicase